MTKREQVLAALHAALAAVIPEQPAGALYARNLASPERLGPEGFVSLHDGEPGEPEPILGMGTPVNVYAHEAMAVCVVDGDRYANDGAREAALDGLFEAIGQAIAANRTLGGLCDWVEARAPQTMTVRVEGAKGLRAARVIVALNYEVADPLA